MSVRGRSRWVGELSLDPPCRLAVGVRLRAKNDLLGRQEVAVWGSRGLRQEVTCMVNDRASVVLDRLRVEFDDERAVADAGLVLPATLAERLGIEALVNESVDLSGRPAAARPGRKVLTLVHAMLLGADSNSRTATCCARAARVWCVVTV